VASEQAAASVESRGVRVPVVRLPQVHDSTKQALVTCRPFVGADAPASSALTQQWLGWRPTGQPLSVNLESTPN